MNRRTTWILVGALIILGGLAYVLNTNPDTFGGPTATPTQGGSTSLWTLNPANIESFSVVDTTQALTFSASVDANGVWSISQPQPGEADQTQLSTLANSLGSLSVSRTITETTDLTDFGLLSPDYILEVKKLDGSALKASIGKKNPSGSAYYVLREGEANAILVSGFSLDAFLALPARPPLATPTPEVTGTSALEQLLPGLGTPGTP